jgi:hypothetical protein
VTSKLKSMGGGVMEGRPGTPDDGPSPAAALVAAVEEGGEGSRAGALLLLPARGFSLKVLATFKG